MFLFTKPLKTFTFFRVRVKLARVFGNKTLKVQKELEVTKWHNIVFEKSNVSHRNLNLLLDKIMQDIRKLLLKGYENNYKKIG